MENYDSYIECTECGHPIERHSLAGCDYRTEGCPCKVSWKVKDIEAERRASGLPGRFRSHEF